jgi:hypothetical protein
MMPEDAQLESRLRTYGSVLRQHSKLGPDLYRAIVNRAHTAPRAGRSRLLPQLAIVAAMLLLAVGAVGIVLRVRDNLLAQAAPRVVSISPTAGATDVSPDGEFRVALAARPSTMPTLVHLPNDGRQEAPHWSGTTLIVKYSGLLPKAHYQLILSVDYSSSLGGQGHFSRSWSFSTRLGPPPAGTPLVWYSKVPATGTNPSSGTQVALDWNGQVLGELHGANVVSQTPDGSRLFIPGIGITDQAGRLLAQPPSSKSGVRASDDSRHWCVTQTADGTLPSGNGEPAWLFAGSIDGALHPVAQFGSFGGQSSPSPIACSFVADRAVLAQFAIRGIIEVRMVSLSSGAVLFDHGYPSQVSVVASHDGSYLAEITDNATLIRRTSDGKVVAQLASQRVVAFSWDASRVITVPLVSAAGKDEAHLVDWLRNQILWRLPLEPGAADRATVFALTQPGGSKMAFSIGHANQYGTTEDLWLIGADGAAKKVVSGPFVPPY